jgi:hypothetical protein
MDFHKEKYKKETKEKERLKTKVFYTCILNFISLFQPQELELYINTTAL